jgi:16S rRNA (cytidine1402-2'-O)-methyltransferase
MSGKLYLVGTPIGNLGDISRRCAETLAAVDFIAAEDTRVSRKLLNHLDIRKNTVSYFAHNSRESGKKIVERLLAGESCALVTDAGMPAISDPGEDLVRLCAEAGVETVAVPGPSAVVTALALSGLSTERFTFEGFLSVSRKERQAHLLSLREEKRTMVFYEAPHKLAQTLADLCETFGEERRISLCREMTKLHEEVIRCTLGEAKARYAAEEPRGEFVLVVAGAPQAETGKDGEGALRRALELAESGLSARDAVRQAAEEFAVSRSALYRAFQQARQDTE